MAPEILRGHAYGVAVDWWALGILVGELATGSTPFHAETPRQLMASILNDAPTLPEDDALAVTLEALLEKEPHPDLWRTTCGRRPRFLGPIGTPSSNC